MKRLDLIKQIIARKEQLNITIENLAKLSGLGVRTVNRVLSNEDVKLSTIESIMNPFFKTSKTRFLISAHYDTSGNSFTPLESKLFSA